MVNAREDNREAILDAVEETVSEVGVRDLSLREVARRAGVSHATPGHHFGDKEGMLAAFAERGFRRLADTFTESSHGIIDGTAYVKFALDNRPYFEVMFRSGLDKTRYEGLAESSGATYHALVSGVQSLQEAGEVPDGDPNIMALHLWSLVHGLASLLLDRQIDPDQVGYELDELICAVIQGQKS